MLKIWNNRRAASDGGPGERLIKGIWELLGAAPGAGDNPIRLVFRDGPCRPPRPAHGRQGLFGIIPHH